MPAINNNTIVDAIQNRTAIEQELADIEAVLQDFAPRRSELLKLSEAIAQTTEVFNGVAINMFDRHITTVDFSIPRSALVFEVAGKPGVFRVQANTRYNGDALLPGNFTSEAAAVLAAKTWITSA